jgi:2'-5' RNA ligase
MKPSNRREIGEYSIWLNPDNPAFNELSNEISCIGMTYDTPLFAPHITLIGKIQGREKDILEKTRGVLAQVCQIEVTLEQIESSENYYRCVYARAKKIPELLQANETARKSFGVNDAEEYMPHLSLAYGDVSEQTRAEMIAQIGDLKNRVFTIKSASLYSTKGPITKWYKLADFSLGKNKK